MVLWWQIYIENILERKYETKDGSHRVKNSITRILWKRHDLYMLQIVIKVY